MSTRETATSSIAHPVTAMAPETLTMPSCGVSTTPTGPVDVPALYTRACTFTFRLIVVPFGRTRTTPLYVPGVSEPGVIETVMGAVPVPDAGVTLSQPEPEVTAAVHATGLVTVCVTSKR